MLIGMWQERTFRGDRDGEHVGVYVLKNHQVVYLRFVQIK